MLYNGVSLCTPRLGLELFAPSPASAKFHLLEWISTSFDPIFTRDPAKDALEWDLKLAPSTFSSKFLQYRKSVHPPPLFPQGLRRFRPPRYFKRVLGVIEHGAYQ
jgi:hypothetical protein